ncbi:MAG TPA: hypothetical protein VLD62_08000 [Acidimicrobiia bacterium]|nr:hypothetical protein [Acidimicrobiia bacterium]
MKQRTTIVTALVLGLVVATAGSAAAAKGGKKPPSGDPPPPVTRTVRLAFHGDSAGIDSPSCGWDSFTARQEGYRGGTQLFADGVDSDQVDLDLRGSFGAMSYEHGVCDHSTSPDSPAPTWGMVWMSFDKRGDLATFMWHFEVSIDTDGRLLERYTLLAQNDIAWVDGVVTATFDLAHYTRETGSVLVGSAPMAFEMTID